MTKPGIPVIERLLARIEIDPETKCWLWMGSKNPRGYGHIGIKAKRISTHHVTYEFYKSVISEGYEIDHLCRTHAC